MDLVKAPTVLVSVCPFSNISTGVERTAAPIGIKFGVSGRWFLNNRIFLIAAFLSTFKFHIPN